MDAKISISPKGPREKLPPQPTPKVFPQQEYIGHFRLKTEAKFSKGGGGAVWNTAWVGALNIRNKSASALQNRKKGERKKEREGEKVRKEGRKKGRGGWGGEKKKIIFVSLMGTGSELEMAHSGRDSVQQEALRAKRSLNQQPRAPTMG